jgi:hypothetical protein
MHRFLGWLVANGVDLSAIYFDGRTVRAARPLAAGERAFLVPGLITRCPEMAARCGAGGPQFMARLMARMEAAGLPLREIVPAPAPLESAVILLVNELIAGNTSAWAPYIDRLPQLEELPATTVFWSDAAYAELAALNDGNSTLE